VELIKIHYRRKSMECILGSGVPWLRPGKGERAAGVVVTRQRKRVQGHERPKRDMEVCKRRALRVGNYEEGRMRRGWRLGSVAATEQERKVRLRGHAMRGRGRQPHEHKHNAERTHTQRRSAPILSTRIMVRLVLRILPWMGFTCSSLHLTHLGQLHSLLGACLLPFFFCLWAPAGLWCHCVAIHQMMTTTATFLCPW
jgi:hypothetical protein